MKKSLVVCGSANHVQIKRVLSLLDDANFPYVLIDHEEDTKLGLDLNEKILFVQNQKVNPFAIWAADKSFVYPFGFTPEWASQKAHAIEWNGILTNLYNYFSEITYNKFFARSFNEKKLQQIQLAKSIGMTTPETYVSNDANLIEKVSISSDKILVKGIGFSALPFSRQPGVIQGFSPPAEVYPKEYLIKHFKENKGAPLLMQNYIERQFDYRISVIGERIIAAKIYKPPNIIDSRLLGEEQSFEIVKLPTELESKLTEFMGRSDLSFGHFDFVLNDDGEYIFLECNPNGMWAFYDENRKISNAYVDFFNELSLKS
jgi:hypothetical protein